MRIYNNIPALQTRLALLNAGRNMDASMQRLSTGVKINSVKDDASGMAITNKLKLQIKGLNTASQNAMDGISMVQTADGALNEVQAMVQRLRELAVQSANGTLEAADREKIQVEVNQLLKEIDDSAFKTEFNKTKILAGGASRMALSTGITGTGANIMFPDLCSKVSYVSSTVQPGTLKYEIEKAGLPAQVSFTLQSPAIDGAIMVNGIRVDYAAGESVDSIFSKLQSLNEELDANVWKNGTGQIFIESRQAGSNRAIDVSLTPMAAASMKIQDPATAGTITINGTNITLAGGETADQALNKIVTGCQALGIVARQDSTDPTKIYFENLLTNSITISSNPGTVASGIINSAAATPIQTAHTALSSVGTNAVLSKVSFHLPMPNGSADIGFNSSMVVSSEGNRVTVTSGNGQKLYVDLKVETDRTNGNHQFVSRAATSPVSTITINNLGTVNPGAIASGNIKMEASIKDYGPLIIQSGPNSGLETVIQIPPISTSILGLSGLTLMSSPLSNEALVKLDRAISDISTSRALLGAYQNRLEYTVSTLDATSENTERSRSRLEDTDMALEMAKYSKDNVISQAAMSIMAQANQRPQQILSLLR